MKKAFRYLKPSRISGFASLEEIPNGVIIIGYDEDVAFLVDGDDIYKLEQMCKIISSRGNKSKNH